MEPSKKKHTYVNHNIPLHALIVFPQVRKSFDESDLQELADDIAVNGVLQPSIVARLTSTSFQNYKSIIEKISSIALPPVETYPYVQEEDDVPYYYVLIAGERRYRGHMILWNSGCLHCKAEAQEKGIELLPGECYLKHFESDKMEIRACNNVDAVSAKSAQFRENNYIKPPLHEEAYSYQEFYRYLKLENPKLTLMEFATKKVGVSTEKVRRALWFCDLPERAKLAVEKNFISFSNAVTLQKILQCSSIEESRRVKMADLEIEYLLMHSRIKQKDYQQRVKELIENALHPTLFDIDLCLISKTGKRRTVANELIPYLGVIDNYLQRVIQLQNEGVIGKGKIYSGKSPTRQVQNIVKKLQFLIPGLHFSPKQMRKVLEVDFEKQKTA